MEVRPEPVTLQSKCPVHICFSQLQSSPPQACEKYESALSHQPSSHAALYNWGVALTDLARCVRDRPDQARACLNLASHKYAEALSHQPGSVQALNNWGLVLQVGWGGGRGGVLFLLVRLGCRNYGFRAESPMRVKHCQT